MPRFQLVPVDRAVAAGLTFRPLAETARDVPEWTGKAGLSPEREAELLAAWQGAGMTSTSPPPARASRRSSATSSSSTAPAGRRSPTR